MKFLSHSAGRERIRSRQYLNTLFPWAGQWYVGLALGAGLLASTAHAEFYVGRGQLSLRATLDQEYDSNIFGNSQQVGDWHSILTPEAIFARNAGALRLDANAGVTGHRFDEHHDQNSVDPFGQGTLTWKPEDEKSDGLVDFYYRRENEANADVNTRTRWDETRGEANFGTYPWGRFGFRLNGFYFDRDYLDQKYGDLRTGGLGVDGRYSYSPKLDLLVGAAFQRSEPYHPPAGLRSVDTNDTKIRVGFSGDILAKVSGRLVVGWVQRHWENGALHDRSGLMLDTSLKWQADEDTTVTLILTRDFDTTALHESVVQFVTGIEARRQLPQKWSAIAHFSHRDSDYIGGAIARRDKSSLGRLGLDYDFTRKLRAEGRVSYEDVSSNIRFSDFDRYVVGLAVIATF